VAFPFDRLTAVAVQHHDSLLPEQPADAWSVSGSNGALFSRLSLSAPWAVFRDAMGPGIVSAANVSTVEHHVTVMFCAHPRLLFIVDALPDSIAVDDRPGYFNHNLSRIPAAATVLRLDIFPSAMPDWHC
jgi:hypothetical protein